MIGVFDSGVGGLSVLYAIKRKTPQVDVVYFGDTENAPYGPKSKREIVSLIAMALRRLHSLGCKEVVAACNSASVSVASVPIDLLRLKVFDVVEMVGPTIEGLRRMPHPVVILGTQATERSGIYQEACKEVGISAKVIAVPELAGLIEKGALREEIKPVVARAVVESITAGAKTISLSCTHFPFVRSLIEECISEAGAPMGIFDPSDAVAGEVSTRFITEGEGLPAQAGKLRFLISKESSVFRKYVQDLFGNTPYAIEIAAPIYHSLKSI